MPSYLDYDSREDFVRSLGLFHYDKTINQAEFKTVSGLCTGFESDLQYIKENFDFIKNNWNNQSIEQIENTVAKLGQNNLNAMYGQKRDKLNAGYQSNSPMYRVNQCDSNSVFHRLAADIGLEHSVSRYHVQFPGEVTVFHTDIFSPAHEFLPESLKNIPDDQIGKDNGIRRILIALEDWNWGQVLMFGAQSWVQWKAGDIVYWNYGVPHCGANMGFSPRVSVSITGLATDKFYKVFGHAQ